jgi:hypothetical protein
MHSVKSLERVPYVVDASYVVHLVYMQVEMGQFDGASSRGVSSNINSSGTSGVSVEGYMGRSTLAVEALTANMHFLTQSMLSMNQLMQHQARSVVIVYV